MREKYFLIKLLNLILILVILSAYQAVSEGRAQKLEKAQQVQQNASLDRNADHEKKAAGEESSSPYKDGEYIGQAEGYGGTIEMKVKIKGGKIHKIETISASSEDASYYDMAKAVIPKITEKQNTDVDTVSGATYSSTGIINAVTVALQKAVK